MNKLWEDNSVKSPDLSKRKFLKSLATAWVVTATVRLVSACSDGSQNNPIRDQFSSGETDAELAFSEAIEPESAENAGDFALQLAENIMEYTWQTLPVDVPEANISTDHSVAPSSRETDRQYWVLKIWYEQFRLGLFENRWHRTDNEAVSVPDWLFVNPEKDFVK